MQKGPFCATLFSAFSTVLHLRPEQSQWELSLVIQPPGTLPHLWFLVTAGPDIICLVAKEVSRVSSSPIEWQNHPFIPSLFSINHRIFFSICSPISLHIFLIFWEKSKKSSWNVFTKLQLSRMFIPAQL